MIKTIVHYVNFYYPPPFKNTIYSEDEIKSALIFRFLYETTFKKNISLERIIYKLEGLPINTESKILRNHLIFHRAFKSFYKLYNRGRGCVYVFDSPLKSEVLGYLTGILYWIFHKGII